MNKPSSPSVLRNQSFILEILREAISPQSQFLEIGSGTGQHAYYFATEGGYRDWQCTEHPEEIKNTRLWCEEAQIAPPIELDVSWSPGGEETSLVAGHYDGVFTANTLHIMPEELTAKALDWVTFLLKPGHLFFVYGPFNYGGEFTSESNANFENWLKRRDPRSGIRNFEDVLKAATDRGFEILNDHEMPAHNRLLQFRKKA